MKIASLGKKAVFAAALAVSASHALSATPKDTLVVGKNLEDVLTLDPAEAYENTTGEIINNGYARLVRRSAENPAQIVGDVADSWKESDDGKSFTFHIRSGQKFPSGRPVTAEDAAYSFKRVIALSKTPSFLFKIFGWSKDNLDEYIKVEGTDKLVLKTKDAFAPTLVLQVLATSPGSIVDEQVLKQHEKAGDYGNGWLRTAWAGSGPFKIAEWKAKEAIVLQANQAYYGQRPHLERVIFRHLPENSAQALLLSKGDIDAAYNLLPEQIKNLKPASDFTVSNAQKLTQIYIPLNQKNAALANPKVREALRWLIDYDGIAKNLLQGQWFVHQTYYGLGVAGALKDNPYKLDVAKAKKLLNEAGYGKGLSISMDVETGGPYPDIAQSLQSTFREAGVQLNLLQADRRQIVTKYRARAHDTILWHSSSDYIDPNAASSDYALNPDNSENSSIKNRAWRSSWSAPEIDKLTLAAQREKDEKKRAKDYQDLQRTLLKDSAYIFLFQQNEQIVFRSNVKGFINGPSYDSALYTNVRKN